MKTQLLLPMAFYVFYMWCSAILTFRTRVRAIKTGEVKLNYFKAQIGEPPSERTILVARHYDNQFQVPILFFITCLVHIQFDVVNSTTLALAWLFVFSRVAHAWILLGENNLRKRVAAFAFGWLLVVSLWIQLLYSVFI